MLLKKNADGSYAADENGFLIQIEPDGSEKAYDVNAKARQIAELTEKASKRGNELEALKARYGALADIEDIAAYVDEHKKNAETVASLADKDRENEAKVQKRISDAVKAAITPLAAERDELKSKLAKSETSLNAAVIGNAFATSAYVNEKLQSAAGAQKLYGDRFYVKDGKAVGRDMEGNDIYGADGLASFDEALCKLVEGSPYKSIIVKPVPGGPGTKNNGIPGGGRISLEQAENLSPAEYAKARKDGRI